MKDRYASSVAGDATVIDVASEHIRLRRFVRRLACAVGMMGADVLAFALAYRLFRQGNNVPTIQLSPPLQVEGAPVDIFIVLVATFLMIRYFAGDYTRRQMFWDGVRLTTISLLIVCMPSFLIQVLSQRSYSTLSIVACWLFLIPVVPLMRQLVRLGLQRMHLWQLPTALIGGGPKIAAVDRIFRSSPALGFDVRYLIRSDVHGDDGAGDGEYADDSAIMPPGVIDIGLHDAANIVRRLCASGCSEVVIVSEPKSDDQTGNLIRRLTAAGIGVAVIPPPQSFPMLGVKINYTFDQGILLLHVGNNLGRVPGRIAKMAMDIVGAAVLLVVLSPLLLMIAYLIKRDDGGNVLFVQRRVGRGGREFPCIKFRSMRLDAEDTLKRWKQTGSPLYAEYLASNFKLRDDPRVTKIGKRLRRSSADELPQLINVLLGQMSLVGPRPLLAREISEYGSPILLYNTVRPGITGLWQVSGRSHTTFAQRANADAWYVQNWSLWYDVVILFKTASVLAKREGAY